MNWLAVLWKNIGPHGAGESPATGPEDAACLDTALRHALRAEVAGGAPRSDSWRRLQQRIQQDAPGSVWLNQQAPQMPMQPAWHHRDQLSTVFLTRFTQLGAALMLLLLLLGDLGTFNTLTQRSLTMQPATPVVMPAVSDDPLLPVPQAAHSNQAQHILSDPSPLRPAAVTTPDVTPRLEVKMKQAAQVSPDVAYHPPLTLPDGGDWRANTERGGAVDLAQERELTPKLTDIGPR